MKPILLLCVTVSVLSSSAQMTQLNCPNNVLEFKYPDGTPIPSGDTSNNQWSKADSVPLALLVNHQSTLKYLLRLKKICKRMGLYLNYRALVFDQGQKLTDIKIEFALKHGNVGVATANALKDSTRFGVFGSVSSSSYRYYVGYERK